jgi:hypothetical protein
VPQVDPDDDTIDRHVVWHYRFDPARNERRNVPVAAYDNGAEAWDRLKEEQAALDRRRAEGSAEAAERLSGVHKLPGHAEAMREQRRAWRRASRARRHSE